MDASGKKREIGRTSRTPKRKLQVENYTSETLGVSLIRDLKAAAARSTPLSSARKWTTRRAINCTSPSSCHTLAKVASSSTKSVFLHDWWLINADGKGLAIGGFTYINARKSLFRSAVTVKRHNAVTLEMKDGVTVMIGGNINMKYSLGNGFSPEILSQFMIGFPCNWEEYASESTSTTHKLSSCPASNPLVPSFDSIPVRNVRDFVAALGANEKMLLMENLYEDLQRQVGKAPERSLVNSKIHRRTGNGVFCGEELPTKAAMEKEQASDQNWTATAHHVVVSRRRVFTRSMTKGKTLTNDLPGNIFQSLP